MLVTEEEGTVGIGIEKFTWSGTGRTEAGTGGSELWPGGSRGIPEGGGAPGNPMSCVYCRSCHRDMFASSNCANKLCCISDGKRDQKFNNIAPCGSPEPFVEVAGAPASPDAFGMPKVAIVADVAVAGRAEAVVDAGAGAETAETATGRVGGAEVEIAEAVVVATATVVFGVVALSSVCFL